MKKGFFCVLLAVIIVVSILPLTASAAEGTAINQSSFTNGLFTPGSGNYYLTEDVTGHITVSGNVTATLDLNGHVLKDVTGNDTAFAIKVNSGNTLTIIDSDPNNAHYFSYNKTSAWTWVESLPIGETVISLNDISDSTQNGSYILVPGGIITSKAAYRNGGNLNIGGSLIMNAGSVVGGSTGASGGGVYIDLGGNFIMNNGAKILGNYAGTSGGGILIAGDSNFTMNGGLIFGNSANSSGSAGGGVRVLGDGSKKTGTFIMNGGTISGNSANRAFGGGVRVDTTGVFFMKGGKISDNVAAKQGGGVYVEGAFTMTDGSITGNTANDGGGVCVTGSNASFNMSGGSVSSNTANQNGGGVYNNGTFKMTAGSIDRNMTDIEIATKGGGVYVGENGTFDMTDGSISGNCARQGGPVYVKGTFRAKDSKITENTSYHGGLYIDTLIPATMDHCQINANQGTWGAGFFISKGSITVTNSQITGNSAYSGGGGVEIENDSCTLTLIGGSVTGNTVTEVNGGLHKGAGIHFNKGTFIIKDEVNITNNKCNGVDSNIYLRKNDVIFDVAEINTKSSLGIFAAGAEDGSETAINITDGNDDTNYLNCFIVDNIPTTESASYGLKLDDNKQILLYQLPPHAHTFTYTANNGRLTATCTSGCTEGWDKTPLTLTLTAPASLDYDGNAKIFTFANGEAAAWEAAGLKLPTITYYQKYSGEGWYTQLKEAPINAGSDYMVEITAGKKAAQVTFTIRADYKVIIGMDQTVYTNATSAKFASNADFSKFDHVEVDSGIVANKYYTAESGSTVITLNQEYIKTLSIGEHTLTIVSKDGSASTTFMVDEPSPQTGDSTNLALLTMLLLSSAGMFLLLTVKAKKRRA